MQPPKSTAVDWSQLPTELLHLISERLDSPLYLLRFRSVCSTWRRSSSPAVTPLHHFPLIFPTLSDDPASTVFLSQRTVFLITPPPQQPTPTATPLLVQIGQDLSGGTRLFDPLSSHQHFPFSSPRVLDYYHHPVLDLGNVFILHHSIPPPDYRDSIYKRKVVAAIAGEASILLTIHDSGKLAFFRSGGDCWTLIPVKQHMPYDDVCVFKGRPCAVNSTGLTVAVGSGPYMEVIAEPVLGGDEKFLVESEGELLMVDKHISSTCYENDDFDDDGDDGIFVDRFEWSKPVKFDVYRLDEKEKMWVELESLGDRVLFLGHVCAFSASASDLGVRSGNCVVFADLTLKQGVGVFPLDVGWILLLSDIPDYSRLIDYSKL
ncbi:F-box protein SKIP23-like [Lotus japonicus]|uniref:F-box protein SKIP23-like n=1 Tax=Lotus japonicus TaxID=34305 RepID=UPI00258D5DA3|nr:F-box protein SKIP23-like [Lotus japonicus]